MSQYYRGCGLLHAQSLYAASVDAAATTHWFTRHGHDCMLTLNQTVNNSPAEATHTMIPSA